ncbi:unnamed protein product, partial [Onchocerca ochengi]
PWFTPSGEIHAPAFRWMAEGVLFSIISRPGCPIDEMKRRFAYVLQPRMLLEIVRVLELFQMEKHVFSMSATENAMERFSRIFNTVLLPAIRKLIRVEDI